MMRALETNRQVLIWQCVLPADPETSEKKHRAQQIFGLSVLIINWSGFAVDFMVLVNSFSDHDLETFLFGIFQTVAVVNALYMIIIAFIQRDRLANLFTQLTNIYTKRNISDIISKKNLTTCLSVNIYFVFNSKLDEKKKDLFQILQRANDISELIWKIFFFLILGSFGVGHIVLGILSVWVCHLMFKEFNSKYVLHSFKFA